jgi:hypothetical protein
MAIDVKRLNILGSRRLYEKGLLCRGILALAKYHRQIGTLAKTIRYRDIIRDYISCIKNIQFL